MNARPANAGAPSARACILRPLGCAMPGLPALKKCVPMSLPVERSEWSCLRLAVCRGSLLILVDASGARKQIAERIGVAVVHRSAEVRALRTRDLTGDRADVGAGLC